MFTMVQKSKGVKLIVIVSMIGMGVSAYIPTAFADTDLPAAVTNTGIYSNQLSKLEIEGMPLDKDFSPNVKEYTAVVDNSIQTISLVVEAENSDAVITVNGQPVTDGILKPLTLQTGENIFLVTVGEGTDSSNTYKLTITRQKNNNNLLKNIGLSTGKLSPEFDSANPEYNVEVANTVDHFSITAEAIEKASSIKINNSLLTDKEISVQLPVGKSDIAILVTAENGDERIYTVHVVRAAEQAANTPGSSRNTPRTNGNNSPNLNNATKQSPNQQNRLTQNSAQQTAAIVQKTSTAKLSSLSVTNGTWDSAFTTDEYTYHLAVANDVTSVTINPTGAYSDAVITVEGSSDKTVQLGENKTVVSVVVTRGEDQKTYVLVFDKATPQAETNAVAQQSTNTDTVLNNTTVRSTGKSSTEFKSPSVQTNKNTQTSFWNKIVSFFKNIFS